MNQSSDRRLIFISMRPKYWVKNLLLLMPLIFAMRAGEFASMFKAALAVLVFCGLSGAGYLINDVIDRESDRRHPLKTGRPIASGALSGSVAVSAAVFIYLTSLALAFLLDKHFGFVAAAFTAVGLAYSFFLKNVVILDLFAVASGNVLRVVAGAEVIPVEISNWLLICAMLLSLFIALSQRGLEIRILQEDAESHRKTLAEYNPYLLDQMTAVITSALLVTYTLYTRNPGTMEKFHTGKLVYTVPFVLYGIFRYLYLIHIKGGYHTLERVLITDKSMIVNLILYMAVVLFVLYG